MASLKRGTPRFMLVGFGLFYAFRLIWENISLSWRLFAARQTSASFSLTVPFGSAEVDLFIGSRPRLDELLLNFVFRRSGSKRSSRSH